MFVTPIRRRVRPHKPYIFLIRIKKGIDLALSVRLSVCLSVYTVSPLSVLKLSEPNLAHMIFSRADKSFVGTGRIGPLDRIAAMQTIGLINKFFVKEWWYLNQTLHWDPWDTATWSYQVWSRLVHHNGLHWRDKSTFLFSEITQPNLAVIYFMKHYNIWGRPCRRITIPSRKNPQN